MKNWIGLFVNWMHDVCLWQFEWACCNHAFQHISIFSRPQLNERWRLRTVGINTNKQTYQIKKRNTTTIIYHVIRFCRRHITIISFSAISRNLVTLRAAASEIGLRNSQEPKWKHTYLHTHVVVAFVCKFTAFFRFLFLPWSHKNLVYSKSISAIAMLKTLQRIVDDVVVLEDVLMIQEITNLLSF